MAAVRGSQAKRGTHGLRKRCPRCKKLRKFYRYDSGDTALCVGYRAAKWAKVAGRWVCIRCVTPDDELEPIRAAPWMR